MTAGVLPSILVLHKHYLSFPYPGVVNLRHEILRISRFSFGASSLKCELPIASPSGTGSLKRRQSIHAHDHHVSIESVDLCFNHIAAPYCGYFCR